MVIKFKLNTFYEIQEDFAILLLNYKDASFNVIHPGNQLRSSGSL